MTENAVAAREWNGLTIPAAGTFQLDGSHSKVSFMVRHLMVSKTRGVFNDVTAEIVVGEDPLASSVSATIQVASVDTGNADRDNHLRTGDFFEAEKYPTITFAATGVTHVEGEVFKLPGELTIKGTTRQVVLDVEFGGVGRSPYGFDVVGFSASTEIDREEFGVTWNAPLEGGGVVVSKKVKIEIEGEAIRQ